MAWPFRSLSAKSLQLFLGDPASQRTRVADALRL
jgi:hypothetical protein